MGDEKRRLALGELWTAEMAAAADRHSMDELGLPSAVLMERAALCVSAEVLRMMESESLPVVAVCGPGNNGGDGLAVARQLRGRGVEVRAVLTTDSHNEGVAQQLALARAHGVPIGAGPDAIGEERALRLDALLGTGSRGAPRGKVGLAVDALQRAPGPKLAVDLPSGIDPDSGSVVGAAVVADLTVTFQRSKPGLHVTPGRDHAGEVVVADIGLVAPTQPPCSCNLISPAWVARALASLPTARHKGDKGHLGLVAGAGGTVGAAVIAGAAALKGGAGLVTLACDEPALREQLLELRPELMSEPRDAGQLLPRATALVVGPGLTTPASRVGLTELFVEDPRAAVWDASALHEVPVSTPPAGPRVLTPHPGEAARLLARATDEAWDGARVQSDRCAAAVRLAQTYRSVVVLKGAGTLVAGPDGRLAVCVTGGPSLATAGTGDVLAGVIGAFVARGLDANVAAQAGVHVHGLAGDWVGERQPTPLAMDVADAVAEACRLAAAATIPAGWPRALAG